MTGKKHSVLANLVSRLRPRRGCGGGEAMGTISGAIKGNMRNVIVVNAPCGIFSEAYFVLRDDYFHAPQISREALLQQAREAAEDYVRKTAPQGKHTRRGVIGAIILALFIVALLTAAALWLI